MATTNDRARRRLASHKLKKIPTRPSAGAVAGKKIGQAVKAKGKAAIDAFRKKAMAARDADQRARTGSYDRRSPARKKIKKIPTRQTGKASGPAGIKRPPKKKPAKKARSWKDVAPKKKKK